MVNKCNGCGKCCIDTEMPVSRKDIDIILKNHPLEINEEDFTIEMAKNHYQLKNIDEHCYFFDKKTGLCKIYDYRPKGCRFYPIIFDLEQFKCIYDKYCPRINLFLLKKQDYSKTCKALKKFLKEQLKFI